MEKAVLINLLLQCSVFSPFVLSYLVNLPVYPRLYVLVMQEVQHGPQQRRRRRLGSDNELLKC